MSRFFYIRLRRPEVRDIYVLLPVSSNVSFFTIIWNKLVVI